MKITTSFIFLFVLFFSFTSQQAFALTLRLDTGRVIYFEYQKSREPGAPTFLLLPGVNRALLLQESGARALLAKGYGVASMNFSVQPFSVDVLGKDETPFFMNHSPSLQELAGEVNELAKSLQTDLQSGPVIPVSLSYSGAVSFYLEDFPVIIETVPLTSAAAQNPQLEAYRNSLKLGEFWNPIFGPAITRSLLDQAYRKKWGDQVDAISKQFDFSPDRRDQMIEGYTTLSRATEGFAWDLSQLPRTPRRVFLFAENESKSLLQHQIQIFENLYDENPQTLLFVIKNSGHVVPSEQPTAYAEALDLVAQGNTKNFAGVVEVNGTLRNAKHFEGAEAHKYLESLIQ
ncbi:MAG TPA: hypothetical protein VN132_09665 [Bdellovibrio sp.]|nr:hypothetical protein [Bdellovibrio sp.]